jgi:hypothetical protein
LTCPVCRRPSQQFRFGVHWPLIKATILDVLAARGEIGASTEEIISKVYAGRRKPRRSAIKSHVWQINDLLETEAPALRIVRDGGRWELRRAQPAGRVG